MPARATACPRCSPWRSPTAARTRCTPAWRSRTRCASRWGLVHGGVFAALADALTVTEGRAISNQTSFLRPITEGTIHVLARRRHRGRTTAVWEVDVTDDAGRLCALVRVTTAY